jgi:hypothetical protein
MPYRRYIQRVARWCGWAAAVLLLLTILTGYGISEFRTVTRLTFSILDKVTAQRLHHVLDVPLMLFLVGHVGIALWVRLGRRRTRG